MACGSDPVLLCKRTEPHLPHAASDPVIGFPDRDSQEFAPAPASRPGHRGSAALGSFLTKLRRAAHSRVSPIRRRSPGGAAALKESRAGAR